MRPLVVDAALRVATAAQGRPVVVVERRRRRGRWVPVTADAAVEAIDRAGPDVVVMVRPAGIDPGGAVVAPVARLAGLPVVLLPADEAPAAWALATASHADFGDDDLVRRLEALVGAATVASTLPRRPAGRGADMPALRPRVIARWAGCAWSPCGRCGGGGLRGAPCGRCGAPAPGAAA
jgi:hypothetical protein